MSMFIKRPFDPTKPVQTRDGRKARIICTDAKGTQPIIALIDDGSYEIERRFCASGSFFVGYGQEDCRTDLINIPARIKREYWVNVYSYRISSLFDTKAECDSVCDSDRLSCVKFTIDCEEGEGL